MYNQQLHIKYGSLNVNFARSNFSSFSTIKFRSIAPIIADGLYKLDYFVICVTRVIGDKLKQ